MVRGSHGTGLADTPPRRQRSSSPRHATGHGARLRAAPLAVAECAVALRSWPTTELARVPPPRQPRSWLAGGRRRRRQGKADAARRTTTSKQESNKDGNLAQPPLFYFFSIFFLLFLQDIANRVELPLFAGQLLLHPTTILKSPTHTYA
jgi:hypothetical protein